VTRDSIRIQPQGILDGNGSSTDLGIAKGIANRLSRLHPKVSTALDKLANHTTIGFQDWSKIDTTNLDIF